MPEPKSYESQQGEEAFNKQHDIHQNPYQCSDDPWQRQNWENGWREAERHWNEVVNDYDD